MTDSDELPGDGIEIVLADDHTMVRRGLRMVLDTDGLSVVVLDLNMPGEPTLPAIPRFREAAAGCVAGALDEAHRRELAEEAHAALRG